MRRLASLTFLAAAILVSAPAAARPPSADYVARLQVLALIESLNADLLSHDSATATLERWCAGHRMAEPAKVTARLVRRADDAASDEVRRDLAARPGERVRYRRVELSCGGRVLSVADNWYLPDRLTPEMNRLLDETDTPFGKAVKALDFRRRTLAAELLFRPLPEGWEMRPAPARPGRLVLPDGLLRHRAVLATPDGAPFSEVVETYTRQILDFPRPH